MSFAPQLFLSNIRAKDGLAKPCRFEVILPIPQYISSFVSSSLIEKILNIPNSLIADITNAINNALDPNTDPQSKTTNPSLSRYLALQCESTEFPGKTLATADVKIYGPTFKVPYQTQYSDASFTFVCTNDFYERKLFERWIEAIMPTDTNNMRFPKGATTRYMSNIKIVQYDDFIKKIFAIELIDAYPIGISNQPLSWGEDNFHRVTIQFAYQKYRVVYDGEYNLAEAAAALFGIKAGQFIDRTGNSISSVISRLI
jgi:hypothetical protein